MESPRDKEKPFVIGIPAAKMGSDQSKSVSEVCNTFNQNFLDTITAMTPEQKLRYEEEQRQSTLYLEKMRREEEENREKRKAAQVSEYDLGDFIVTPEQYAALLNGDLDQNRECADLKGYGSRDYEGTTTCTIDGKRAVIQTPWLRYGAQDLPDDLVQVLNYESYNDEWALGKIKDKIAKWLLEESKARYNDAKEEDATNDTKEVSKNDNYDSNNNKTKTNNNNRIEPEYRFYLVSYYYCSPHGEEKYWEIVNFEEQDDEDDQNDVDQENEKEENEKNEKEENQEETRNDAEEKHLAADLDTLQDREK